jgi:hypothetical protein
MGCSSRQARGRHPPIEANCPACCRHRVASAWAAPRCTTGHPSG